MPDQKASMAVPWRSVAIIYKAELEDVWEQCRQRKRIEGRQTGRATDMAVLSNATMSARTVSDEKAR